MACGLALKYFSFILFQVKMLPVKVQGCQTLLGDCLLNVWKMAAKDLIDVDKQAIINLETGNI